MYGLGKPSRAPANKQFDGWYENAKGEMSDEKYEYEGDEGKIAKSVNLVAGLSAAPAGSDDVYVPGDVTIDDPAVPLAGLDGNFRPDDLVLRSVESLEVSPEGELQEFLNRYAVYAGIELDEGELFIELEGQWDDVIMGEDAQAIFDDFFAKLEAALSQAA